MRSEGEELQAGLEREPRAAEDAIEQAKHEALAELAAIESDWSELRGSAAGFSEVADWLAKGDTVIGLLRTRTELALDAQREGDLALSAFMTSVVESDLVMYRFIAWHTVVYVNLLSAEPQLERIDDAFAADDREFTGRAQAEEYVDLLMKLAGAYRTEAPKRLALVKVLPAEVTRTSGGKLTLTVTIAAHGEAAVRELFASETEKFIQDQTALQTLNAEINQFLDTAAAEGMVQAAEAVTELLLVRGRRRGGPRTRKAGGKKRPRSEKKEGKKKQEDGEGKGAQDRCKALLVACLENPWQPKSKRRKFGMKKDCGACYRECRHAGGRWPYYKCPLP